MRTGKLEGEPDKATGGEACRQVAGGMERPGHLPMPSGTLACPAQQSWDGLTCQTLGLPGARALEPLGTGLPSDGESGFGNQQE